MIAWLSDGRLCEYGDIESVFQKRQLAAGLAQASAPQLGSAWRSSVDLPMSANV
jgi:hypothetical protein